MARLYIYRLLPAGIRPGDRIIRTARCGTSKSMIFTPSRVSNLHLTVITPSKEYVTMGHGIIAWIIIGVIAGWLTGKIMKGSGYGFFMDMIVGLIGALIGGFISSHLGLGGVGDHGLILSIAIAVLGAVILTFLLRLVAGNRS
jgi:uncharacterized membrane protein YeaQ/YmgE (transglycosylase-associated protein family)